jgi:hypothetical protein
MYNPSSHSAVADKRRAYTGASSGMPPRMPPSHSDNLNSSVLSAGANGPSGSTPTNTNYRKAFKPNIGNQSQSSYEPERRSEPARRNLSNSHGGNTYDASKYENESPPRQ